MTVAQPFPSLELVLQQLPEHSLPLERGAEMSGEGLGLGPAEGWTPGSHTHTHTPRHPQPSGGSGARVAARAGGPPAPRGQHSSLGLLAWVSPGKGGGRASAFRLGPHRPASSSERLLSPGRIRIKQGLHLSQPSGRRTAEPWRCQGLGQSPQLLLLPPPEIHLQQGALCSQRAQSQALRQVLPALPDSLPPRAQYLPACSTLAPLLRPFIKIHLTSLPS